MLRGLGKPSILNRMLTGSSFLLQEPRRLALLAVRLLRLSGR